MRLTANVLVCSLALFGLTAGASAQGGPPGPFCRSDADFLTATAAVLQRGIPAFLEVEVALQNKTQGRIHFDPRRFVTAASGPASAPAPSPTAAARVVALTARASTGPVVVSVSIVAGVHAVYASEHV